MSGLSYLFKKFIMFFVFHMLLKHLIKRNYKLRCKSAINGDGRHLDKWYWADSLALEYGYAVKINARV